MNAEIHAIPTRLIRRRRRGAAIVGGVVFLLLAVAALVALGLRSGPQPMAAVLRANHEIRPGSKIAAEDIGVTSIYVQDPSVLATLAKGADRKEIVGQIAIADVAAGALVPANLVAARASAAMWRAAVPVKRMPADLKAGDHVALMAEDAQQGGQDLDFVVMQDVVVLDVGSGTVDLWLPATAAPQIEWYAGHGGLVLLTMKPGSTQAQLPIGRST